MVGLDGFGRGLKIGMLGGYDVFLSFEVVEWQGSLAISLRVQR